MELKKISNVRREYGEHGLLSEHANNDPFTQFEAWLQEALASEDEDPTAMVLATVDDNGMPDTRVVLLKEMKERQFIFFTNFQSTKGKQLLTHSVAALNFYWPSLVRQVRIRGTVAQVAASVSDAYFASRPRLSQISAIISPQSQVIAGRAELEQRFQALDMTTRQEQSLTRPQYWGGYAVLPFEFEFWQGRDNRLHDRLHYRWDQGEWLKEVLAP